MVFRWYFKEYFYSYVFCLVVFRHLLHLDVRIEMVWLRELNITIWFKLWMYLGCFFYEKNFSYSVKHSREKPTMTLKFHEHFDIWAVLAPCPSVWCTSVSKWVNFLNIQRQCDVNIQEAAWRALKRSSGPSYRRVRRIAAADDADP